MKKSEFSETQIFNVPKEANTKFFLEEFHQYGLGVCMQNPCHSEEHRDEEFRVLLKKRDSSLCSE